MGILSWIVPLAVTIIIAIFSLVNSHKQVQLQHNQICINLMEKRLHYYEKYLTLIDRINSEITAYPLDLQQFIANTHDVDFLFGAEVRAFQDKFVELVRQYIIACKAVDTFPTKDSENLAYTSLLNKQGEIHQSIMSAQTELFSTMKPYLDFSVFSINV